MCTTNRSFIKQGTVYLVHTCFLHHEMLSWRMALTHKPKYPPVTASSFSSITFSPMPTLSLGYCSNYPSHCMGSLPLETILLSSLWYTLDHSLWNSQIPRSFQHISVHPFYQLTLHFWSRSHRKFFIVFLLLFSSSPFSLFPMHTLAYLSFAWPSFYYQNSLLQIHLSSGNTGLQLDSIPSDIKATEHSINADQILGIKQWVETCRLHSVCDQNLLANMSARIFIWTRHTRLQQQHSHLTATKTRSKYTSVLIIINTCPSLAA